MTSTLSGTLSHGITLGTGGAYTAPFTISQTGTLNGAAYSNLAGANTFLENLGFDESVLFANGGTVQNAGTILNPGLGYGILMRTGPGTVTNAENAVIYGGNYGIAILQGAGNITNAGSIAGLAGAAIEIADGTITNQASGAIYAHEFGVKILNAGGTIENAGTIIGQQYGVSLNGGVVTNAAGATITGQLGGLFDFSADATFDNAGIITQTASPFGTGVKLFGGTLINTGFIYGATGIYLANAGTVFNAGTIAAMREAIDFAGASPSRLIAAPGAVFAGGVTAAPSAANTLELTAGKGTISGLGSNFIGFKTIALDSGADWLITGAANGFAGDSITGFTTTDQLDIARLSISTTTFLTLSPGYVLDIPEPTGATIALTFTAINAGETFELTADGHGGDLLTALAAAPPPSNAVTLQPGQPNVTISGPINTFGIVGTYAVQTGASITAEAIGAAVFDPAGSALTVTNASLIQSNGSSPYDAGILLGGAVTFNNEGTIIGATGISDLGAAPGAYIESSNRVQGSLGAGIYLQAYGSALNMGALTAAGTGLQLMHGGYGYNSGVITARTGIYANGASSYVYNAGLISAAANGITMPSGGFAINAGTINAGDDGIFIAGGAAYNYGAITAATGMLLSAPSAYAYNKGKIFSSGDGIYLTAFGLASNAGTIHAGATGIDLLAGGVAYNYGAITAATGIAVTDGGTIVEYGTLSGTNFAASFTAGAPNLFVMNSSSRIQGEVSGGGGELELAAGRGTGTIALTQFENFSDLQVDAHASWIFTGSFSTGIALNNNGIIKLAKSAQGTFDGGIGGAGTIVLSSPKPLTFGNYVAASQQIAFSGAGETLNLADPAAFAGSIANFAAGDTIDVTGISLSSITGTAFAGNVLTMSEAGGNTLDLTFANTASLGSDVFLLTQNGAGFAITLEAAPKKMAVLKPAASTTAHATAATLPPLTAAAHTAASPTYITPSSAPGFLSTFTTPSTSAPVLITLQS